MAFNKEQKKVWRRENAAKINAYKRDWVARNPEKAAAQKERARLRETSTDRKEQREARYALLRNTRRAHRKEEASRISPYAWVAARLQEIADQIAGYRRRGRSRKLTKEQQRKKQARWRKLNPEKRADMDHARRARERAGSVSPCAPVIRVIKAKRKCYYCGKRTRSTIDHVVPLMRGGAHDPSNLVPACAACNSSKGVRSVIEFSRANPAVTQLAFA